MYSRAALRRGFLLAGAGLVLLLRAQAPSHSAAYDSTTAEIAMRDGIKLHTEIHVPKHASGRLPILMVRTPYNASNQSARVLKGSGYRELARDGYIFVFQDIRGRYKSEGQFVMMRPPRDDKSDPKAFDEGTDAYDTID